MSTYLAKFKIIEPQSSMYRWFAIHSSVGVCFQFSKWRKSIWFPLPFLIILTRILAGTAQCHPGWNIQSLQSGASLIQFIEKQSIGSLVAFPFSPYLTDGLGRRPAIAFGAFIMIVATILQTASNSVGMFIGAR